MAVVSDSPMNGKVLEGLDDSDAHAHQQPSGASPIASIDDDGAFLEKEVHKGLRITFQVGHGLSVHWSISLSEQAATTAEQQHFCFCFCP